MGSNKGTKFRTTQDPQLVGHSNEVDIDLNNISTSALLDTGSCVSLISESFYNQHFSHVELRPLTEIINIKCANGDKLQYKGFVELDLQVAEGFPKSTGLTCLFLVAPDTDYSSKTPVIIGTNILEPLSEKCKKSFGLQYLQKAPLHTPWYLSFRCLTVREKELKKYKNKIAIVKSAETNRIILGPNETIDIEAYTDRELDCGQTYVMVHETEDSSLPNFIDITPTVLNYRSGRRQTLTVNLSNLTSNSVVISPKAILCEIQPVDIEQGKLENDEIRKTAEKSLSEIHVDTGDTLTAE